MKNFKKLLVLFVMFVVAISCGSKAGTDATSTEGKKIKVTTTLNYYVDLLNQIGGDKVEITGLMKEGEDPHLYVATAGDVEKLNSADLVVYGGLHLEGKMVDIFDKLQGREVLNLGDVLDKSQLTKVDDELYDPHVWFNTQFWALQAKAVADKLSSMDAANKDYYQANLEKYMKDLDEATKYIQDRINEIPEGSRYLVTAHDAFGYFSKQFGLKVESIQGVSTDSEVSAKRIEELAQFIADNKIKAIFTESSVSPASIHALEEAVKAKGWEIKIGDELYSDSMGDKEHDTDTYIKTIKANADKIANALK